MFAALQSIMEALAIASSDKALRANLIRPALRAGVVYIASFLGTLFLSVAFALAFYSWDSLWSTLLYFLGSVVFLVLVPVLASFVYFSFFCDGYYQAIAEVVLTEEVRARKAVLSNDSVISGSLKILILLVVLLVMLVFSFFFPFVSVILGAFIFSADTMSHSGSYLGLSYYRQGRLICQNLVSVVTLGVIGVGASLFPFAFIIVYPLGVLSGAFLLRRILPQEQIGRG
ncbi:MAG TPA: hypothetical protein PKA63_13680 [Oligoflexia bacterium]|nr:hypothetical protein [Oligoflexia bacterium]HMP49713.1 hypothetical protein [Oligoflexia bacterium]